MNPDVIKNSIQAVIEGLTPLAEKLKIPIEGLWGWALKHNYALAFESVLGAILTGIALYFTTRLIKMAIKADKENDESFGFWVGGIVLSLIASIAFIIFSIEAIDRFVAPEYNTAKDISCLVHSCNDK